jgi:anti-repressor protein
VSGKRSNGTPNAGFNNNEMGLSIRVILNEQDGEPWFVAKEVAVILGYSETTNARHCRCVAKHDVGVETGKKGYDSPAMPRKSMSFFPERDLYRLTRTVFLT